MANYDIITDSNMCQHTGFESTKIIPLSAMMHLEHHTDQVGRNRFVVVDSGERVAAILFDSDNVCMFRETLPEHRRKGHQNNLWAFSAVTLGNIKHSEYMTDLGRLTAKIN